MQLTLRIDNVSRLASGGPLVFTANARNFVIGREGCDWNLPDTDRFISGRHCEVVFSQGAFWLKDVSRNGTFLNGATERLQRPCRLENGNSLQIGRYMVSVHLADGAEAPIAERTESAVASPIRRANLSGDLPAPVRRDAVPAAIGGSGGDAVLKAIEAAAGVAPNTFTMRDPAEVAADIGAVLKIMATEVSNLLKARAAAKAMVKSSSRTVIGNDDNNPLKFVPAPAEILDIMFGRKRPGYMDARTSVEDAFRDLKAHELATYSAMQAALARLLDDISPETIDRRTPPASFGSKKAKAWDVFVATWQARENAHENGMLDVFLAYFAEAYGRAAKAK